MQQAQISTFLKRFFQATNCPIIEEKNGYFTVQLTVEMDKELMNRPFYWHYLEKTGGTPNPMKLTFITDSKEAPGDVKGEWIHFGSPRLHQIFAATKKMSSYIRLYEQTAASKTNVPLHPWIGMNITISYICDKKKDQTYSLGLHLINGRIVENFQEQLEKIQLTPKIPDFCFTITPLITPKSGLTRLKHYVIKKIEEDDHRWAEEARERMNADLALLEHFYEDLDEKPSVYWTEKKAIQELYEPRIEIEVHNGGIFYLSSDSIIH